MAQGIQLLGTAAGENRKAIREVREFLKFILPYAEDGEWGHDQHPVNSASVCQSAGDGDSGQTLACPHFHE